MYFLMFIYKDGKIHGRRETRLTSLEPPIWRKEKLYRWRKHDITRTKKKVRSNHNNKGDIMWRMEKKEWKKQEKEEQNELM